MKDARKRGQAMIAISVVAAALAVAAAAAARDRRWQGRAIVTAMLHIVLALAMGAYWVITGIPQPWTD